MSKENINLPKTSFSMKANLPNKEPEILKMWEQLDQRNAHIEHQLEALN